MKIKTDNLTGPALDWAVAKCDELLAFGYETDGERLWITLSTGETELYMPRMDWSQAGPIIEREGIRLHRSHTGAWWAGPESDPHRPVSGPTPRVAAMRCFVASRLGDEVDVPDELMV